MCGQEYYRNSCVLVGWQPADDLPCFGKIEDILVIGGCSLLWLQLFTTAGINSHLLSYQVSLTLNKSLVILSTLVNKSTYTPHTFLGDNKLYITMRSYVIK